MEMSESIGKLAEALSKAQGQMDFASKDANNPFFKSKYADLASVWGVAKGPLTSNGLAVIQTADNDNPSVVTVTTTLVHSSGEWARGRITMKPVKDDPQGIGSCITYARRYGLSAIIGIVADEDDDGNKASGLTTETRVKAAPKPRAEEPAKQEAAATDDILLCSECATPINQATHAFSMNRFKKALCRSCQGKQGGAVSA
jgi:hypothetical protein